MAKEGVAAAFTLAAAGAKSYARAMNATLPQPVPRNLRQQLVKQIESVPEDELEEVHDILLLRAKLRLLDLMSEQAEREQQEGKHDDLAEYIRQHRARRKSA
jgi:hypothetical protein